MNKLNQYLPLIILFLLVLPTVFPLFHSGFFTMHDDQQIIRLAELDQALTAGQFPVRWVSRLGFGYGYPLFIFYPPLIYYLSWIFHTFLFLDYISSIKLVFGLSFFGSAITMYYWSKHHFGQLSAFVSALFYIYVPYRAVDAYVRGALAETFSFVWLPLILLSIDHFYSPKSKQSKWGLIFALSYAALMTTHNLIVLPFTIIIAFYILLKLTLNFKQNLIKTLYFTPYTFLGLGLSTFFWLPSLSEKQFTLVDNILLTQRYTYTQHFVFPTQLWNSLWGYGGSTEGILDGFTFKIGKLHLVLSALVFITTILNLGLKKIKTTKQQNLLLVTCSLLLIFSAFMTTTYSITIWQNFSLLHYLQFPWRFLTFTALFSSFLAGSFFYFFEKVINSKQFISFFKQLNFNPVHLNISEKLLITVPLFLTISLLLLPNLKLFRPQHYLDVTDNYYLTNEFAKWQISKTSFEFVPKDVATNTNNDLGITQLSIDRDQIALKPFKTFIPQAQTQLQVDKPHKKTVTINTPQETYLQFNTFNFPGWTATLDDQPVNIRQDNPLKLITLDIPIGEHQLTINFKNTPIRTLANSVSLVSILLTLWLTVNTHKSSQSLSKKNSK